MVAQSQTTDCEFWFEIHFTEGQYFVSEGMMFMSYVVCVHIVASISQQKEK